MALSGSQQFSRLGLIKFDIRPWGEMSNGTVTYVKAESFSGHTSFFLPPQKSVQSQSDVPTVNREGSLVITRLAFNGEGNRGQDTKLRAKLVPQRSCVEFE